MIDHLNDPQRAAVTIDSGHALVLAGAGSGKTRVLTTRIAWLIQNGLTSPLGILAVTFTNKASKEMQVRVASLLPIDTRNMWVGTFHGLCHRLLRAHFRDASLPQGFQILDTADQLSLIKRLLKANQIDDEKFTPRDVQRFINSAKEEGLRSHAVEVSDPHQRRMVEIYALYEAQCQRDGVVDFAELLLRVLELLERHEPIRAHYQRRFRHILVDEFQDTNALQYRWLKLLSGGGANIFAVGDDDQSIYAFRGADVGNMSDFERDYARGAVIRLEQNYRSQGHILDAANHLIAHNSHRLGKNLWTDQGDGELIRAVELPSDGAESQWLSDEIKALVGDGISRLDIAILYRSNAQSRVIEHALFSAGIPYRVYGGLRFFERQEIKHALAYLRLVMNRDDDTSFNRVVNFPARGIGARTIESLVDQARTYNTTFSQAVARVAGKGGGSLAQFSLLIETMAQETRTLTLSEAVEHIIEASGLLHHYRGEKEGAERIENLGELVNAATVFETEHNLSGLPSGEPAKTLTELVPDDSVEELGLNLPIAQTPLSAFLAYAALESGDNQAQAGQDAVQMMTVHAAKGLEFDAVFITGLEDGLFPHENSIIDPSGLQEERRLMYVAITRARKRLYMTMAQSRMLHGQTRYAVRSRFLDEVPENHVKWLTARGVSNDASAQSYARAFGASAVNSSRSNQYGGTALSKGPSSGLQIGAQLFRVGQGVRHARFGEGTIIGLSGSGLDAQAQIHFADVGSKTLALGIAKLDIMT
jgi:DNA helicase-2/ATP-dependent DNA helicase PcrA